MGFVSVYDTGLPSGITCEKKEHFGAHTQTGRAERQKKSGQRCFAQCLID
jgi:hypothetical protein